jgi:hypothetical protein
MHVARHKRHAQPQQEAHGRLRRRRNSYRDGYS